MASAARLAASSSVLVCMFTVSPSRFWQRGGSASYFDQINERPAEGHDESWNKYSAPVAAGMKVGSPRCALPSYGR